MKQILRIKHWQLFLTFILPMYFAKSSLALIIITEFELVLFSFWIYSTVKYGQFRLSQLGIKKYNSTFFITNCILLPIIWLTIRLYISQTGINLDSIPLRVLWIAWDIYFFVAFFYMSFFAAKTIVAVDKEKDVNFKEYFFTMIGCIFIPIGIWFIQPKINKLK
jgi:hypothetical protein